MKGRVERERAVRANMFFEVADPSRLECEKESKLAAVESKRRLPTTSSSARAKTRSTRHRRLSALLRRVRARRPSLFLYKLPQTKDCQQTGGHSALPSESCDLRPIASAVLLIVACAGHSSLPYSTCLLRGPRLRERVAAGVTLYRFRGALIPKAETHSSSSDELLLDRRSPRHDSRSSAHTPFRDITGSKRLALRQAVPSAAGEQNRKG